jgi:hypothetical protein
MLAVEIDGAVHRIKGRFKADLERHNVAQMLGWRVLRFSTADVKSAKAVDAVRAVLAGDEQAALAAIQRRNDADLHSPKGRPGSGGPAERRGRAD